MNRLVGMALKSSKKEKKKPISPKGTARGKVNSNGDTDQSEGEGSDIEGESVEEMMKTLCKGMKKMDSNFKEVKDELASIKSTMSTNYVELNDKLDEYVKQNAELENKLDEANERIDALTACNEELYREAEKIKDEKRIYNVIFRGIPEVDNEKIYETMGDLFGTMQNSFPYINTHGAVRLGRVPKPQNIGQGNQRPMTGTHRPRPPRPIKLYCATRLQKGELFRNAQKLKQNQKYARSSVTSDLTEDQLLAHKEVQLIHNATTKLPNVTSKMKGNMVEIDGKVYQKQDFGNLPHGITLEQASTILTKDGVAFAGHCSPLSNLYECQITDGENEYNSAEQRIVHNLATLSGDKVIATKVLLETNPYKIKNMSKQIQKSDDWSLDKEKRIVKESIVMKFDQNKHLREKLTRTKATQFYEATYDPLYGAGFSIIDAHKGITTPKPSCANYTGGVLTELKAKYLKSHKK